VSPAELEVQLTALDEALARWVLSALSNQTKGNPGSGKPGFSDSVVEVTRAGDSEPHY